MMKDIISIPIYDYIYTIICVTWTSHFFSYLVSLVAMISRPQITSSTTTTSTSSTTTTTFLGRYSVDPWKAAEKRWELGLFSWCFLVSPKKGRKQKDVGIHVLISFIVFFNVIYVFNIKVTGRNACLCFFHTCFFGFQTLECHALLQFLGRICLPSLQQSWCLLELKKRVELSRSGGPSDTARVLPWRVRFHPEDWFAPRCCTKAFGFGVPSTKSSRCVLCWRNSWGSEKGVSVDIKGGEDLVTNLL